MFNYDTFTRTKDGKAINEDTIGIIKVSKKIVAFIADGVSNSTNSFLASQIASDMINDEFKKDENLEVSPKLLNKINDKILDLNSKNNLKPSATTLTILSISETGKVLFNHVGDCRIYVLRNKGLKTLTTDQTEKQLLIKNKILNKARAAVYKNNKLYSALGSSFEVEIGDFDLINGDRVILCSDGIYNIFLKKDFVELSTQNLSFIKFKESVFEKLEKLQFKDDASLILIEYLSA